MEIQLKQRCWFLRVEKRAVDPRASGFVQGSADEEYCAWFWNHQPVGHSPLSEKERSLLKDWLPDDPIQWYSFSNAEVGFGWGFFNLRLKKEFPIYQHFWSC